TDHGWHNLIGKVFSRESFNVFDAMRRIWRVGLDKDSEFAIPEPLAYVPSLRLLLQEKAIGKHAKEVFLAGSPAERAEAAERCAHWLMWFQILAPKQGKIMKVRRLLRRSERRLRQIVDADRKSTRLNSSHRTTSYAVFCLKKKSGERTMVKASTRKCPLGSRRALNGTAARKLSVSITKILCE